MRGDKEKNTCFRENIDFSRMEKAKRAIYVNERKRLKEQAS